MQNKKKIAFFDFCETLVKFQTADRFVDYIRDKTKSSRMERIDILQIKLKKFISIAETLTHWNFSINKKIKLYQLKGLSNIETYALAYYQDEIKPNLIPRMISELVKLQKEGWDIVIVSGGYNLYLQYFAEEFGVKDIVSSKIEIKDGICTGKMEGSDCLNMNKVKMLKKKYKDKSIQSVAYSDSITDIPFLKWANKGYVVSKNKSQKWAKDNKLEELLWQD